MFSRFLRRSHGKSRDTREAGISVRRPRNHLLVEALEDRLVLSVFNVNSTADTLTPAAGTVTLRSAIDMANSTPGNKTIQLTWSPGDLHRSPFPERAPDTMPAANSRSSSPSPAAT